MEHLQFSTAFSDSYQVFLQKGTHNMSLNFDDKNEIFTV